MAENIIPIYSGPPDDFHWVGFGSGSGTNLRECSKLITPAMVFSDRPKAGLLTLEELADVPKQVLNGYKACGSWKKAKGYPEREAEYEKRSLEFNEHIVETLRRFEREVGYNIDLIVLGGYMRMVKEPLLTEFKDRMINVHPSELNLDHDHQRQYTGDDAVYDVLNDNYPVTRSSVIIVDQGEDHGEILVQGPELEVWEEFLNGWDPERQECIRE
ncbi:MAG: hypothetical protein KKG59_02490, partial [Nanoarchaeota archaeon]|nr:hypothetical protein [Nanoarchaeota archaeon]MBU1975251.1 hypothetical protein [Nanoarchaeota archaeon]